jgi:hypothetical protein
MQALLTAASLIFALGGGAGIDYFVGRRIEAFQARVEPVAKLEDDDADLGGVHTDVI